MTTRHERRLNIEGELLPPEESRTLVPVNQTGRLVRIRLPRADDVPMLEHEVKRPVRAPSFEADVKVPFVQAFLTAIAVGVCVGMLAWALHWSWRVVAVSIGLAVALAWLWRLRLMDSLLWEVETITGRDVNHDGATGKPAESGPVLVNAWQARQEVAQVRAQDEAQGERAALVAFVHRCFVSGCSESAHGVKASGPDRETYVKHRDALLSLGIAAWKNPTKPKAGWRIVVSHQRAIELIAKHAL